MRMDGANIAVVGVTIVAVVVYIYLWAVIIWEGIV
jgi:hypothetical protein